MVLSTFFPVCQYLWLQTHHIGEAERVVQKAQDPYLALLTYHSRPTAIGFTPSRAPDEPQAMNDPSFPLLYSSRERSQREIAAGRGSQQTSCSKRTAYTRTWRCGIVLHPGHTWWTLQEGHSDKLAVMWSHRNRECPNFRGGEWG